MHKCDGGVAAKRLRCLWQTAASAPPVVANLASISNIADGFDHAGQIGHRLDTTSVPSRRITARLSRTLSQSAPEGWTGTPPPPREPARLRPYHGLPGSRIPPKSSSPMPSVSSFPMHLLSVLCTRGARRCSCDLPLFADHDSINTYLRSDAGLTPPSLFDTLQTTQPFAMW